MVVQLFKLSTKDISLLCLLGAIRMEFLGHQVGGDVIIPSRDILEKVRNTPRPSTKKQVRSFWGYNKDHIPAFTEISAPLTNLLKKGNAEHIKWSEAQERAYSRLKEYLFAGTSPEASRFEQAVCTMDRRIWSWGGGCATTGEW